MKKPTLLIFIFCIFYGSLYSKEAWDSFKNETISKMSNIEGWCGEDKARQMMDIIQRYKCKNCVEIGVFSGKSLFPIARALQFNGNGVVFAIDAWNVTEATKGFNKKNPNYVWWNQINYKKTHQDTIRLIIDNGLDNQCHILKQSSQQALNSFSDKSIDFIHFDGNHNEDIYFEDVSNYFSKVKNNGFIVLNDPNWVTSKLALVFLLERTELISTFSPSATYFVFRKNKIRLEAANELYNN